MNRKLHNIYKSAKIAGLWGIILYIIQANIIQSKRKLKCKVSLSKEELLNYFRKNR
jgi:hypothetical protein